MQEARSRYSRVARIVETSSLGKMWNKLVFCSRSSIRRSDAVFGGCGSLKCRRRDDGGVSADLIECTIPSRYNNRLGRDGRSAKQALSQHSQHWQSLA